ncbi:MAG: hypothetical protein U5K75_09585 [Ahrensia sp.]|nr:hypothetical protein [Ahrensia sp.]
MLGKLVDIILRGIRLIMILMGAVTGALIGVLSLMIFLGSLYLVLRPIPPEEPFDRQDCFSLSFVRYKVAGAIFDAPYGVKFGGGIVRGLEALEENWFREALLRIPDEKRLKGGLFNCQKKTYVPIEMVDGTFPYIVISDWPRKGGGTIVSIHKPGFSGRGLVDLENAFEFEKLNEVEFVRQIDKTFPGDTLQKHDIEFRLGMKSQKISCSNTRCYSIYIIADGLLLSLRLLRSYRRNRINDPYIYLPNDEMMPSIVPIIEKVLSFRNKAVEGQYQ